MTVLEKAFTSLFQVNMGLVPGERIIIFTDTIRPGETVSAEDLDRRKRLHDLAVNLAGFAEARYGNTAFVAFPATAASGAEPPKTLWEPVFGAGVMTELATKGILDRILGKRAADADLEAAGTIIHQYGSDVADVVIALANNSTSHTTFRQLVNAAGGRFASLPHFEPDMFFTSMMVDWHAMADRTSKLAAEINAAVGIRLETPNGTRLAFSKEGRTAAGDDGLLGTAGSFGNLPAGEVYLAPVEGTSEGILVIEYAPTRKLATPLTLIVREGNVVEIRGEEPFRVNLEQAFAKTPLNRNIAELGIGTNDRATRPDNILEAEKILGTIHIALGDNSGFGGMVTTPFHEDFVFYEPTLTALLADGTEKQIIIKGALSTS